MSARTPEATFWNWLRDKIPGHCQRVENTIDFGTPDVNACYLGVHVWIETKVKEGNQVKLRKEQKAWAMRRSMAGGKVYCVADMMDGTVAAWSLPCATETINDKYQKITALPDFVVRRTEIDHLVAWMFKI